MQTQFLIVNGPLQCELIVYEIKRVANLWIIYCSNQPVEEQDVQLTNDKKVMSKYSNPRSANSGKPVNQGMTIYIYIHI